MPHHPEGLRALHDPRRAMEQMWRGLDSAAGEVG